MGRALFNDGVALFNKGDFEGACPKFEASLKNYPGLGTRGKLAECYEKLGRFASAWTTYREVAQLATRSGEPAREQFASERAKALEPKLSYLTVTVPAANDVAGLVIKRNGREVERAKLGSAEPVDPGTATMEISAPGKKTFTGQIAIVQAQSQRFDVPPLANADAPPPPPPPGALSNTPPPSPEEPPPTIHGDPPQWQKPLGIVLIGAGAVGLGIGAVLGLAAKSKYDGAFSGGGCDSASKTCDAAGQSAVDDAHSKATLSTIMFAAGTGVALVGVVVLVTAPSSRPRAYRIAPSAYVGGAGLSFGGSL
jgi:hypothetical protein